VVTVSPDSPPYHRVTVVAPVACDSAPTGHAGKLLGDGETAFGVLGVELQAAARSDMASNAPMAARVLVIIASSLEAS
jgi:hypothetical protein